MANMLAILNSAFKAIRNLQVGIETLTLGWLQSITGDAFTELRMKQATQIDDQKLV